MNDTLLDKVEAWVVRRFAGMSDHEVAREVLRACLYNMVRAEAARTAGVERPEVAMPPDDWGGTPVR